MVAHAIYVIGLHTSCHVILPVRTRSATTRVWVLSTPGCWAAMQACSPADMSAANPDVKRHPPVTGNRADIGALQPCATTLFLCLASHRTALLQVTRHCTMSRQPARKL